MRKISTYSIILLVLSLFFTGCAKKESALYKNGVYFATYDHVDADGWKPQLEVTVEKGTITAVTYDDVNPKGALKSQNKEYALKMTTITKKQVTPAAAAQELAMRLVAGQTGKVDAVSGATKTSEWFNSLSLAVQEKAKKGDKSKTILVMNETYTAKVPKADERGYTASIQITFTEGKISKVIMKDVGKNGVDKRNDENYNSMMKSSTGVSWKEAAETLEKALVTVQDPAKIDAVSGASQLSAQFVKLATEAIAARK